MHYYWPTYAALAREAGSHPNALTEAIPESDLFTSYARICLHIGKIPTSKELRIATRELRERTHTVDKRFGSITEFDRRFREWLESAPQKFRKILGFRGWNRGRKRRPPRTPSSGAELAFHPFLPAGLQFLDVLARGEKPPAYFAENVNTAFERRCADAFRCLGFEVQEFGQGRGRKADFVAKARSDQFAVVADAKVRGAGYVLGTEDRKFLEYAKTHARELQASGFGKVYLVVIGLEFREADLEKLTRYLAESPIRSVDLLSARALMRIVEQSIRERCRFTVAEIDRLLFGNKIISE